MAASEVEVCNLALARVGVKATLYSLADGTAEANAANAVYRHARDACLSAFPWTFATRRASPTPQTDGQPSPTYLSRVGWDYIFSLPEDCLVVRRLVDPDSTDSTVPFAVEGADDGRRRVVLANLLAPELVYTAAITDPAAFTPLFVDALGWLVASDLVMPLNGKDEYSTKAYQRYQLALAQAGAAELRQSAEPVLTGAESEFIRARAGSLA